MTTNASGERQQHFLTSADVGKRLNLTPAAIRDAAKRGALRATAVTPGGVRLFTEADVEAFVLARRRGAPA